MLRRSTIAAFVRSCNISSVGEDETSWLSARALGRLASAFAIMGLAGPLLAADAPQGRALEDCLNALSDVSSPAITCSYRAELTQDERADIRRLTREILQDATCRVEVKIDRALIAPALGTGDHEFSAPPQPVTCEIKTNSTVIPIAGTFAPTVKFQNGIAVDGSPGLANVTGVNAYLAWPVVQYINRAPGIRRDMLAMINAYKSTRKPETRAALGAGSHLR